MNIVAINFSEAGVELARSFESPYLARIPQQLQALFTPKTSRFPATILFPYPTPAVRLLRWTFFVFGGPCLSAASWSVFLFLRPSHLIWPDWASMVLPTFAETKVGRLPGRNPAIIKVGYSR